MQFFCYLIFCLVFIFSYQSKAQQSVQLSYVEELSFADLNAFFPKEQHPEFGGFSGMEYDSVCRKWYIITDGRPPMRTSYLYEFKSTVSGFPDWLTTPTLSTFPTLESAESLRLAADRKQWIIASEGDDEDKLATGDIHLINRETNSLLGSHSIITKYPANRGLEAIAIDRHNTVWTMSEWPSFEDQDFIRIRGYNLETKTVQQQYAYTLDKASCTTKEQRPGVSLGNGVSEMLMESDSIFWTVERCFNGKLTSIVLKRIQLPTPDALTVQPVRVLQQYDLNALLGNTPDNIEGATFGPLLPDGSRTLCLIADDNFSRYKNGKQKTVFIVLKLENSTL